MKIEVLKIVGIVEVEMMKIVITVEVLKNVWNSIFLLM